MQAIRAVRTRVLGEGDALKTEGKRVLARAKRREGDADRLRHYLKELLLAHRELNPGVDKIETADGFVRLNKKTGYEVTITSFEDVSEDYLTRPDPKLNKSAIVSAHRNGLKLAGLTVAETITEHVMEGG